MRVFTIHIEGESYDLELLSCKTGTLFLIWVFCKPNDCFDPHSFHRFWSCRSHWIRNSYTVVMERCDRSSHFDWVLGTALYWLFAARGCTSLYPRSANFHHPPGLTTQPPHGVMREKSVVLRISCFMTKRVLSVLSRLVLRGVAPLSKCISPSFEIETAFLRRASFWPPPGGPIKGFGRIVNNHQTRSVHLYHFKNTHYTYSNENPRNRGIWKLRKNWGHDQTIV